jgi:hypothetical protein
MQGQQQILEQSHTWPAERDGWHEHAHICPMYVCTSMSNISNGTLSLGVKGTGRKINHSPPVPRLRMVELQLIITIHYGAISNSHILQPLERKVAAPV